MTATSCADCRQRLAPQNPEASQTSPTAVQGENLIVRAAEAAPSGRNTVAATGGWGAGVAIRRASYPCRLRCSRFRPQLASLTALLGVTCEFRP